VRRDTTDYVQRYSFQLVHLVPAKVQRPTTSLYQSCSCCHNRKGKRSALVDHHMKNKQHRSLMAEMDKQLRKVTIVSGMAQRLTNKVAIVTGVPVFELMHAQLCSGPARSRGPGRGDMCEGQRHAMNRWREGHRLCVRGVPGPRGRAGGDSGHR
jgi:hypothetical protein